MIVVAHNVRSLHNVGSILRNAAAFGIEKVFLTGYTAAPPRKEIAKVSLGAEDLVTWEHVADVGSVIDALQRDGYAVFGLETGEGAVDISSLAGDAPLRSSFVGGAHRSRRRRGGIPAHSDTIALVLGNEVDGIDAQTRSRLDGIVEIPMAKKRSLNVSVASGVAMYCITHL